MRTLNFARGLNWVWVLALAAFFTACNQMDGLEPDSKTLEENSANELFRLSPFGDGMMNAKTVEPLAGRVSSPVSNGGIVPYIIDGENEGGNRTCEEVYEAYGITFDDPEADIIIESSGKIDYENGSFVGGGFSSPLNVTTNGTFVSWSITPPAGYCVKYVAAIVKGGNDANIYFSEGITSDTGLASPPNASGKPAGLSNLTFCWVFEKCDTPPSDCWKDETAWAAGSRYVRQGNWATYTPYVPDSPVTLFAGQTLEAGTVSFSTPVDGMIDITISLNLGWRFAIVDENVKVQDYATVPSGSPNPGGFAHKATASENPFTITVPANEFYGVHVDVERSVPCPL